MNPRLLLVAPLLIAGLAACGDDDESGSGADFCTVAREVDQGGFADFASAETPEEVEAAINSSLSGLEAAADAAPDEISDSIDALLGVYRQLAEGLEEVDYDIVAFFSSPESEEIINSISGDEFTELETYLADECGIDTES